MSRAAAVVIFLAVALTLFAAIHYYFWLRLVRDTALPRPARLVATALLVALPLLLPLSLYAMRRLPRARAGLFAWPAFVWMGVLLYLLLALGAVDLWRALMALGRLASGEPSPADPARRVLLARVIGAGVVTLTAGVTAMAMRTALGPVRVHDVEIPLPRLPRELDGTTIVQLSDLHLGPTIGRSWMDEIVRHTNALHPDLIAVTGDLVDGSVAQLARAAAPIAALRAPLGVYFVTGNHEYYSGAEAWCEHLRSLGIRVLRNERVAVGRAGGFDLAGVDDYSARGMEPGHGQDIPKALAGRDPSRALVLLAHQPRAVHEAARHGVDLQLSGHTHGGQLWPWGYLVRLQQPFLAGLAREGDTQIYVSPGTGYWGPPMRLGAPPAEITRISLRAA